VFLREVHAGYVIPCRVFVLMPVVSFLPSVRGLEYPLSDGSPEALL
jgi:hypothetical protein